MTKNARRMTNFIGAGGFMDDGINNIPTPPIAIQALNHVFPLAGKYIWEPACGEGYMSKVLEEYGALVYGSDIRNGKHIYGKGGRSFESFSTPSAGFDAIITNPPYGKSFRPFLQHACRMSHFAPVFLFTQNSSLVSAWSKQSVQQYLRALYLLTFSVPFLNKEGQWRPGGFKHMWSKWGPRTSSISSMFIYKDELEAK